MRLKLFAFIMIGGFLLSGCIKRDKKEHYKTPVFPRKEVVSFDIVTDSLILPVLVHDIAYKDGRLLLLYGYEMQWLHIYNLQERKLEKSLISVGRGPQEMLYANTFSVNPSKNTLNLFDYQQRKLLSLDCDSIFNNNVVIKERIFKDAYFKVIPKEDNYITYFTYDPRFDDRIVRFFLQSAWEETLASFNEYPVSDSSLASAIYTVYSLDISPDQTKMASATLYGGILECFDISQDQFEKINTLYVSEPFLKGGKDLLDWDKTLYCFGDLWTTNELIYAAYGAKDNKTLTSRIAVFDWKGNPLKLYETDHVIQRFCIDEKENVVYAIIEAKEGRSTIIGKFSL